MHHIPLLQPEGLKQQLQSFIYTDLVTHLTLGASVFYIQIALLSIELACGSTRTVSRIIPAAEIAVL